MKLIPVLTIIGVLIFGGFILAELGTKTIKLQNQIINSNLTDFDK